MAHHTITENGSKVNCYEYAIKTEDEYNVVLQAIDKLMDIDPPAGSIPGDILLWLSVSAHEFEERQLEIGEAVRAERERCAKICEAQAIEPECPERAQYCADAIRMQPNKCKIC